MRMQSEIILKSLLLTLIFSFSLKGSHRREAQEVNISVVPVTYNPQINGWVALLGFEATIYQGGYSFRGEKFWKPFDLDRVKINTMHTEIINKLKQYGLDVGASLSNAQQIKLDNTLYYIIPLPFAAKNRAQVLYEIIQENNAKTKSEAQERFDKITARQDMAPTIIGVVDVRWISVQELIDEPANKTWGTGGVYNHKVDPIFKTFLKTHWKDLEGTLKH